ncbi:MAG: SCO family protein [Pseudomonadota bacterium]
MMTPFKSVLGAACFLGFILLGTFFLTLQSPDLCQASRHSVDHRFSLISETGQPTTHDDFKGDALLVYFGYSYCPDVCPFDLARNADVVDILAARGLDVTPVFITLDPDRDTVNHLIPYTDFFHPKMVGLTGDISAIKTVADGYSVYVSPPRPDGLIDHSTLTYLILPNRGFIEFFQNDLSYSIMAERVECLITRYGSQT